MTGTALLSAESVVGTLIHGHHAERMEAQKALEAKVRGVNLDLARRLILESLDGEQAPLEEARKDDDEWSGARCWLLGALDRVPAADGEPDKTLRRFIDHEHEWSYWARYWALQALINRNTPDIEALCRSRLQDPGILPRSLAKVLLASKGDRDAADELKNTLTDPADDAAAKDAKWGALRALRFVYLPFAVEPLCQIVNAATRSNRFDDVTFDAIVALGHVPPDSRQAHRATNELINLITHSRQYQYWDVLRIRALEALGKMGVPHSASLLLEEIKDLNPSIVQEAATALAKVMAPDVATTRILERLATGGDREAMIPVYASALRYMGPEHQTTVVNKLESAMVSGAGEGREDARRLLREMGGSYAFDKLSAQAQGAEHYLKVLDSSDSRVRDLFEKTIDEGRRGFRIVIAMDVALFVTGLVLLGLAVGLAVVDEVLISVLTASGGLLSAIYGRFFAKPRQQIEDSVTRLAALKTVFLGYLRQLSQIDQAYARLMLERDPPTIDQTEGFTRLLESVMGSALEQLDEHGAAPRPEGRGSPGAPQQPEPPVPDAEATVTTERG